MTISDSIEIFTFIFFVLDWLFHARSGSNILHCDCINNCFVHSCELTFLITWFFADMATVMANPSLQLTCFTYTSKFYDGHHVRIVIFLHLTLLFVSSTCTDCI